MHFMSGEIKVGSTAMFAMGNSEFTMYGKFHYQKITPSNCIAYTQQFCDEQGNIYRHPGVPKWPETMINIVTLTEEGSDLTRVTIQTEASGTVAADELKAFIDERAGMTQGWTGSFDKLDEHLTFILKA